MQQTIHFLQGEKLRSTEERYQILRTTERAARKSFSSLERFENDSAKKYIQVLNQKELEKCGEAIRSQAIMNVSTVKELQSMIISTGASITPMVDDVSKTIGLDDEKPDKEFPQNHLYAADFFLPPGFTMEKWALLGYSHHQAIPYLTDLILTMEIENKNNKGRIRFRDNPQKYDDFLWYDPLRDTDMNFYLIKYF